ncbi:MAG: glycosyltransferase family 4 protein [Chloroflexi bacterium]|nr:glycosyltransferase family 4 protein [Chloroflexota bacterium]
MSRLRQSRANDIGNTHYIDISAAVHARSGLGRYSESLAKALIAQQPERFALFYNQGHDGRYPPTLNPNIPRKVVRRGYKPWRMAILLAHWAHISFNRLVPNAQLFHSTEHLLMPLKGVPTVLTVHDLIYKLFPAYHKKLNYWYLNLAMPLYCRRADAIIAVSQASKQDIVKHYDIDPTKIHVVYEAPSSLFQPVSPTRVASVKQTYELPARFLVHLSVIEPRKNLSRLLDSLKALRYFFPDLSLVLVGGKGWLYDDFFAKIERDGLQDAVCVLGWVPDEDLPAILAAADLAVQPSLYEGFGLPILEHMACGQVVAASHSSSHPEVGGEAAVYFDPVDVEEMTAVIHHLLTDKEEYRQRQQLGYAQAAQFSWQRTAKETIAIYDGLLQK